LKSFVFERQRPKNQSESEERERKVLTPDS